MVTLWSDQSDTLSDQVNSRLLSTTSEIVISLNPAVHIVGLEFPPTTAYQLSIRMMRRWKQSEMSWRCVVLMKLILSKRFLQFAVSLTIT